MDDFKRLELQIKRFNVDSILRVVWSNPRVKEFIIELNTEGQPTSQLFEKGEDSLGDSLGEYAPSTIEGTASFEGKISKGQRFDHITLKDTGDFYDTWVVIPFLKGFRMKANPVKEDSNLFDDFGEDIVGLNEENLLILCAFIKPFFIAEAKKRLS